MSVLPNTPLPAHSAPNGPAQYAQSKRSAPAVSLSNPPAVSLSNPPAVSLSNPPAVSLSNPPNGPALSKRSASKGFTIVEVMMASVILVVGFVGMIEAVTVSAKLMDAAQRQMLATQIINHEIEKLRFAVWTNGSTGINDLPTASTTVAIDTSFWPAWNSATPYVANRVVSYGGAYYRCILAHTNQTPPNATYWTASTTAATSDIIFTQGATYTLARTVTSSNPVTNIREVNFTVTWVVKTSRVDAGGSPLTFTFTRKNSAWFGKYGLNFTYQRS